MHFSSMKRLLYIVLCLLSYVACAPQETEVPKFDLTINEQVTVEYDAASLSCTVSGNFDVEKISVEYSVDNNLSGAQSISLKGDGKTFTGEIKNLKMDTKYFYRYSVSNRFNSLPDKLVRSFTTLNYTAPQVSTLSADAITGTSAILHGSLDYSRGETIKERGFMLGTSKDQLKEYPCESEDFSLAVKDLEFDTKYYYQAFVVTEIGRGEGELEEFSTLDGIVKINTQKTTDITTKSATAKGFLASDGGDSITRMGFLFSEKEQFDSDAKEIVVAGITQGAFSAPLENLKPNTKYYVKTFAINGRDTFYGEIDSFATDALSVSSITLNRTEMTLNMGASETLYATISPEGASKEVTWSSTKESVARVDQTGKVTAIKDGTTKIQAKAGDKTATCSVTVVIPPEKISISESSITLEEGQGTQLTSTVEPDEASQYLIWESSDNNVATVENGWVDAVKAGTCTVTARVGNLSASCEVTVTEKYIYVNGITLNKNSTELIKGESETLVATVKPENATDKTVIWSSADESIASVDQNGKITANKGGQTTVYAQARGWNDYSYTAYCTVIVKVPASSITLDKTSFRLGIGNYQTISATVKPDDTTDKITWSSSDPDVVSCYPSGTVEGRKKGTAVITATAGECSATCSVEVIHALSSVSLTCQHEGYSSYQRKLTIKKGDEAQFQAEYSPTDADVFDVEWISSDPSVVTIDNNGLLKAVGAGSADIKIIADEKEASCSVTVLVDTEYITLNKTEISMDIGETIPLVATLHPEDATDAVKWKSSKESVVTVDQNGNITAIKAGDAVITVSAGGKTASCDVNVKLVAAKYLTFSSEWNVSLSVNYKHDNIDLYWSRDKITWKAWDYSTLRFGPDNELYLCGKNSSLNTLKFIVTGTTPFSCTGDIMSLIDMTKDVTTILSGSCFAELFSGCTLLQEAPDLTATTLSESCYASMFSGCTALMTAPKIAATKVAARSCESMFYGCTSLETPPELHATEMASRCYEYMFGGCTNLKIAPELPATILADRCYYFMFYECSNLTDAPKLPALTMKSECYSYMFYRCNALTSAPELPAMNLAEKCYLSMFDECNNLTSASSLPAITLAPYCYESMFYSCDALEIAPAIEATTVAEGSCQNMFRYCSKLTKGPELKAKILERSCYSSMFESTNLNYLKCMALDWSAEYCTSSWLRYVSTTGTFVKDPIAPEMPRNQDGIPSGWTVVNAE